MFGKLRRFGGTNDPRLELEARLRDHLANFSADQTALVTRAIGQATRVIMAKLANMERRMEVKINDLLDVVERQNTKIDSYQALFASMHERYLAALGADNLTPSQKMRMQQVLDAANKNIEEIDSALAANTDEEAKANTVGAVTTGPSAAEIKSGIDDSKPVMDPGPAIGSTDPATPAT